MSIKDIDRVIGCIGFEALLNQPWVQTIDIKQKYSTIIKDVQPGDILLMTLKGTHNKVTYTGAYCHMMVYAGKSVIAGIAEKLQNNWTPWAHKIGANDDLFTTEQVTKSLEIARTYNFEAYNNFREKEKLNPTYTIARINWSGLIDYTKSVLGLQ